jgi:hypothetical protein
MLKFKIKKPAEDRQAFCVEFTVKYDSPVFGHNHILNIMKIPKGDEYGTNLGNE